MMFKWTKGRQDSGYFKMGLLQTKWFDMWLLKFPKGSSIPEHTDPVDGFKHYRINVVLLKANAGGVFKCNNTKVNLFNRVFFFRPDKYRHGVTEIKSGTRYVLSIGWAR